MPGRIKGFTKATSYYSTDNCEDILFNCNDYEANVMMRASKSMEVISESYLSSFDDVQSSLSLKESNRQCRKKVCINEDVVCEYNRYSSDLDSNKHNCTGYVGTNSQIYPSGNCSTCYRLGKFAFGWLTVVVVALDYFYLSSSSCDIYFLGIDKRSPFLPRRWSRWLMQKLRANDG